MASQREASMLTVKEVNSTFAERGLGVKLPLPDHFVVKALDVLEKRDVPGGMGLLLSVRFINDQQEEVSDIFFCEGELKGRRRKAPQAVELKHLPKSQLLPHRSTDSFASDDEARTYIAEAFSHLLQDKGYQPVDHEAVDLCFEDRGDRFYLNLAVRCDDAALEKAKEMAELRLKEGVDHEYGLAMLAFQESLGVPLLHQDRWMFRNTEYLAANRIGIYAVDNWNPNLIYGFTIYPQSRELKRYFMVTASQWQMVRQRYVAGRSQRRRESEL